LWQREHEYAVAALRVDLVVAAGRDRDVLLAVDHVGDARRIDAGAAVELPQLLAGARVVGLVPAVRLAVEHDVTRGREHAADQRLRRLVLPCDLAAVEVDRDELSPLLFGWNGLERAAQPQLAA